MSSIKETYNKFGVKTPWARSHLHLGGTWPLMPLLLPNLLAFICMGILPHWEPM